MLNSQETFGGRYRLCFLQNKTSLKFPLENQILISDLIYFSYFRHFDLKNYLAVAPATETRKIENLVLEKTIRIAKKERFK